PLSRPERGRAKARVMLFRTPHSTHHSPLTTHHSPLTNKSEHAAAHLVALDALEQRLEIAFAEALVALALDDLEEDRADRVLGEYLQQLALLGFQVGVDENLVLAQAR